MDRLYGHGLLMIVVLKLNLRIIKLKLKPICLFI